MAGEAEVGRLQRDTRPALRSGWTTRRWLTAGVGAAVTVLLVLGVFGGLVLARANAVTDTIVDHSFPALNASVRLEAGLLDQETGIRGYGLSGQVGFLQPYTVGLAEQRTAVAQLRPLMAHDAVGRTDLNRVLADVAVWQRRTARPIAASPHGAPVALATEDIDTSKGQFDAIRSAATTEQDHLQMERDVAATRLRGVVWLRDWVFSAIALVIALLVVLVFAGLRRGVTAPLEALSSGVRRVGDGDFAHAVVASGPADMRRLAEDVEAMRHRLVDELEFAGQARSRLDEQAMELRRSNAELEQFAYVASHDLQEPLRKVASFCQLLQRRYADQLDERADQYIAFAVDGATRMQSLINDLLAFSRVGRTNREHVSLDLNDVVDRTLDALGIAIEEAGAVVTHDPLPTVEASTQVTTLMQNLIANAVKFRHPDRPPRVHLSARRAGDFWEFAIADNGIGIGAEYAQKVFVIFQRLHTREEYPGNGIGLAMCKKIVEYHGGTIAIDPAHEPGARIVFTLPAAPESSSGGDEAPANESEGSAEVPSAPSTEAGA